MCRLFTNIPKTLQLAAHFEQRPFAFDQINYTVKMQRKVLNSIIMGAPGGGKGTISKKLVKDFGFTHVSNNFSR